MGRHGTIVKNRVYVECTDAHRRVKAHIITKDESMIKVELPTGFVLELRKRYNQGSYRLQLGMLEFISDGKPVA